MNVENKKGLLKGRKNKSVKKGLGALYQCSYKILWKMEFKGKITLVQNKQSSEVGV